MMMKFKLGRTDVMVGHRSETLGNDWVWNQLKSRGEATVSNIFRFQSIGLIDEPSLVGQEAPDELTSTVGGWLAS